jgi:hypothetical protein
LTSASLSSGISSIGVEAFSWCPSLTSVTIPSTVTSIGDIAFYYSGLTNITIPGSVTNLGLGTFAICSSLTSVTIQGGVTSIGERSFNYCTSLTSVTLPDSITDIGDDAFYNCSNLTGIFFYGNAPASIGLQVFDGDTGFDPVTVYYLPGTTGWDSMFADVTTALWLLPNPLILNNGSSFGVPSNGFGFIISWATNISVVVEASTNLSNPEWQPVQTNTLTSGEAYFSDPQWTNYPGRFYRLRSP